MTRYSLENPLITFEPSQGAFLQGITDDKFDYAALLLSTWLREKRENGHQTLGAEVLVEIKSALGIGDIIGTPVILNAIQRVLTMTGFLDVDLIMSFLKQARDASLSSLQQLPDSEQS